MLGPLDLDQAEKAVSKLKADIEVMRRESKPTDEIPAAVMFTLLDAMIPVMEGMLEKIKEKEQ